VSTSPDVWSLSTASQGGDRRRPTPASASYRKPAVGMQGSLASSAQELSSHLLPGSRICTSLNWKLFAQLSPDGPAKQYFALRTRPQLRRNWQHRCVWSLQIRISQNYPATPERGEAKYAREIESCGRPPQAIRNVWCLYSSLDRPAPSSSFLARQQS
jgi:hypothetical protein